MCSDTLMRTPHFIYQLLLSVSVITDFLKKWCFLILAFISSHIIKVIDLIRVYLFMTWLNSIMWNRWIIIRAHLCEVNRWGYRKLTLKGKATTSCFLKLLRVFNSCCATLLRNSHIWGWCWREVDFRFISHKNIWKLSKRSFLFIIKILVFSFIWRA